MSDSTPETISLNEAIDLINARKLKWAPRNQKYQRKRN